MKAKKVSVCLIALISVLAILVYPLLSNVRINDFSEKIVLGCGFAGEESLTLKQISKAVSENVGTTVSVEFKESFGETELFAELMEQRSSVPEGMEDAFILNLRNQRENFYKTQLKNFIDESGMSEMLFEKLYLTNSVKLRTEDMNEGEIAGIINKLLRYDKVSTVSVENHIFEQSLSTESEILPMSSFGSWEDETLGSMNAGFVAENDFAYKGHGVNVGIIEPSAIDPNAFDGRNDLPDITINSDWQQGDEMSEHSRRVTRIIGNMAPKISLYTRKLGDNDYGLFNSVFKQLKTQVNVINCSFGFSQKIQDLPGTENDLVNYPEGKYCKYEGDVDTITKENLVVVVKSAGNNGDGITCFGNAANVITVGATDYEGNLASYSSKNTDKMAATKPTLVANGMPHIPKETIWFHGNGNTGTSFAAPFVTGTVAIMMNKKPSLKLFPEMVHSLLTANTSTANYTTVPKNANGFLSGVGAGMLNVGKVLDNLDNTLMFSSHNNASGDFAGGMTAEPERDLPYNILRVSVFWYANSYYNKVDGFPIITNFEARVYIGGNLIASAQSHGQNYIIFEEIIYKSQLLSGNPLVQVYYISGGEDGIIDVGSAAYVWLM